MWAWRHQPGPLYSRPASLPLRGAFLSAVVAQLVEQLIRNQQVGGSTPLNGTISLSCTDCSAWIARVGDRRSIERVQRASRHQAATAFRVEAIRVRPTTHTARRTRRHEADIAAARSEEHTSELQSRENLVCRLLLEKKKKK